MNFCNESASSLLLPLRKTSENRSRSPSDIDSSIQYQIPKSKANLQLFSIIFRFDLERAVCELRKRCRKRRRDGSRKGVIVGVIINSNRPLRCWLIGIRTQNHKLLRMAAPIWESDSISKVLLGLPMKPFQELSACKSLISYAS